MSLVVGEFGQKKVRVNAGFDLTTSTVELKVMKPGATVAEVWSPVVIGVVDTVDSSGNPLLANQYASYTVQSGDLDVSGAYECTMIATYPAGPLKTVQFHLDVEKAVV